ncbi:hypothetical protein [Actinomadura sp. HBU206391]|uniref:hypothetical protein n=1 Tax=Actinomadura sp. HBU206391 TaxID=2731692 RepID=UPI0016503738|nr:hypothetical protein [Actinomadura sp. HBU206391]MBC6460567.1 hypothetical protein [Actinomadura sp. HBU206391]
MSLELELLAELRVVLADEHGIRSHVRKDVAGLAVETDIPAVYVWVFVGFSGRFFSWHNADRQHPVNDVSGTARRIAEQVSEVNGQNS